MTSADVEASEHVWSVEPTPASVADLSEDTWSLLRDEAMRAMRFAYVPYSSYPVGAAALVDDGRIVSGANIENASFGVTLCAECSLVSDLFMSGGGRIVAFDCVDGAGRPWPHADAAANSCSNTAAPRWCSTCPAAEHPCRRCCPKHSAQTI